MRLAIVGASVRAAAESAIRGGMDVVAADLFADADLASVCPAKKVDDYPDGLAGWLAQQDVDAWMYTGALENSPELVDEMAAVRPLLGVSGEALRRARDPLELQRVFREAGVVFPETLPPSQPPPEGGGWLTKTYRHAAGAGVARWSEADSPAYAQRFVEGQPMSALYAVGASGAALLGLCVQLVGERFAHAGEWAYCGSIGPVAPSAAQADQLGRIGKALASPLGLRGVVGVDLIADGDELTVLEINPRYPASAEVAEKAGGRSVVEGHARACDGTPIEPWPPGANVRGKLVLFAKDDFRVSPAFTEWLACEGHADRPSPGETIAAGRPVCTLLTEAEDIESVRRALRESAAEATRRRDADDERE